MKNGIYRISISFLLTVLFISYSAFSQPSWNALGTGTATPGTVYASTVFNGELIVAGLFVTAGGTTVNNIARWNGTTWAALGTTPGTDGVIFALTVYNGQLVAGGAFTTAGGTGANNIARWNGTTWADFGLGTNDTVYALGVFNTLLRAGGKFTTAGGIGCVRVGAVNGIAWQTMGAGCNNTVFAFSVFNGELIIGGQFTAAGTLGTANRIVRYNTGGGWTNLGTGVDNNAVYALAVFAGQLYVGGNFTTIASVPVNNLARWTGANWNTVGTGTNGPVRALYTRGTDMVLGGTFTIAGTTAAANIATWNGTAFGTLGTGLTGGTPVCNTATNWSNILIAGGNFTTATDNVSASNVAAYGAVPAIPILISPPNGSIGISLTPLLDWSDVAGATTYRVQLSASLSFSPLLVDVGLLGVSQYQVGTGILANDITYFWRANATNGLGTSGYQVIPFNFRTALVGIINTNEIPVTFALHQNYPNPFNPTTKIKFDLPQNNSPAKVLLEVYNAQGQVVNTLLNTDYAAGKWEVDFDASSLASGFYFYKINAGEFTSVNKMILIK